MSSIDSLVEVTVTRYVKGKKAIFYEDEQLVFEDADELFEFIEDEGQSKPSHYLLGPHYYRLNVIAKKNCYAYSFRTIGVWAGDGSAGGVECDGEAVGRHDLMEPYADKLLYYARQEFAKRIEKLLKLEDIEAVRVVRFITAWTWAMVHGGGPPDYEPPEYSSELVGRVDLDSIEVYDGGY